MAARAAIITHGMASTTATPEYPNNATLVAVYEVLSHISNGVTNHKDPVTSACKLSEGFAASSLMTSTV
jgi:hypothetical protein